MVDEKEEANLSKQTKVSQNIAWNRTEEGVSTRLPRILCSTLHSIANVARQLLMFSLWNSTAIFTRQDYVDPTSFLGFSLFLVLSVYEAAFLLHFLEAKHD